MSGWSKSQSSKDEVNKYRFCCVCSLLYPFIHFSLSLHSSCWTCANEQGTATETGPEVSESWFYSPEKQLYLSSVEAVTNNYFYCYEWVLVVIVILMRKLVVRWYSIKSDKVGRRFGWMDGSDTPSFSPRRPLFMYLVKPKVNVD